jgi:hypothetical protein
MRKHWRLIVGWAIALALLTGLALMGGPRAGAAVPVTYPSSQFTTAPTIAATVACDTTTGTWTVTYTLTSISNAGYWIYPDGGAPNAGTVNGLPTSSGPGSVTFTVTDIANGTTFYQVDVLSYSDSGWNDLFSTGPINGTCAVVTPTTTTTTVLPGTVGASLPTGTAPVVSPALSGAGPLAGASPLSPSQPSPPAVSPPLAFTGAYTLPTVALGLFLIGLGSALLRLRRRMA